MNAVNILRSRVGSGGKSNALLEHEGGPKGALISSKPPVQVEPKTYFANERTFIQWISAALLLLTVSSIMMGSGHYNGTSTIIAFSSLILVAYAVFVYFRRVSLLRSGEAYGYLDFVGPTILAAGVGLGVLIVFADAVKGSEFVGFAESRNSRNKYDDRRLANGSYVDMRTTSDIRMDDDAARRLIMSENGLKLQQVDGICSRHAMEGINLLEYQPRDILFQDATHELLVATPQALVSHPLLLLQDQGTTSSAILSEFADTDIQSMTTVGDRLFALSVAPLTELIEFKSTTGEEESRFLIKDSPSNAGSMVFVPSSDDDESKAVDGGKFYIYLDGSLHSYHLGDGGSDDASLSLTGTINMKVLNRGLLENEDPVTEMVHFEGLTYVLRERQNTIEVWDLPTATLKTEMPLPDVWSNDKWVGMAMERRNIVADDKDDAKQLRGFQSAGSSMLSSVYLHMPLDTFPPQLWSFRLDEHEDHIFSFPACDEAAMN